jgi:hypothetical protein
VRFSFSAIKRVGVFCLMRVLSRLISSFDHDRGFERPSFLVRLFFAPAVAVFFGSLSLPTSCLFGHDYPRWYSLCLLLRRAEEEVVVVAQPVAVLLLKQRARERAPARAVLRVGRQERPATGLVAQGEAG